MWDYIDFSHSTYFYLSLSPSVVIFCLFPFFPVNLKIGKKLTGAQACTQKKTAKKTSFSPRWLSPICQFI